MVKYPIGTQSFETLRNDKCVYVDKTRYVYDLANSGSHTYFLSRPRRFGKSLFLSTLEAYFKGKKELFEGLYVYEKEKEWKSYPVLHLDFSGAEALTVDKLEGFILLHLQNIAKEYGMELKDPSVGIGPVFGFLIKDICEKTKSQVVVLIDEYDKGIVEVLENEEQLKRNQEIMRPFFAQLKQYGACIRFCFIMGVSRFRHYSLFSGFNNPDDLSMQSDYADICGITLDELISNFDKGIQDIAQNLDVSFDNAVAELKRKYDGYRFTKAATYVFNPFSILNCLKTRDLSNYWIKSGTSAAFTSYLAKSNFKLEDLWDLWVTQDEMEGNFETDNPIPLLFQTGYFSIVDYRHGMYRLGIPNGEVRSALVDELMPRYMGLEKRVFNSKSVLLKDLLENGNIGELMQQLASLIAKVPYHEFDYKDMEKTYHLIVYSIFLMIDVDVQSEIAMSGGRIDMVATTNKYVYVMEFKLDGTPDEALEQINSRGYAIPWQSDHREIIKVGVSFSSQTHTIASWKVQ